MSLLKSVTTGVIKRPHYLLMHGSPGIGKSTFAATFPKPIFLCAEKGTANLNVSRLELDKYTNFEKVLQELLAEKHDYKTVVVDTVDHLEPLIFKEVCADQNKPSIESIRYAKGYVFALDYWLRLVGFLEELREKKDMNVVFLAHTEVKAHNDPQLPEPYDTYKVKLHHKAASILIDRVDCVLFANHFVALKDKDSSKVKAYGDGSRMIYTEHRPAFQAKNRFDLPFEISFEETFRFEDFDKLVNPEKSEVTSNEVKQRIAALIKEVKDKELKKKIESHVASVGDDLRKLTAACSRLQAIVAA